MIKELIIGLGGAGSNVLNDLFDNGYVNLLLISPDKENIKTSSVQNKVHYKIEVNKDITKKNTQSVGHTKSRNASNDDEIFNKVVDLFDGEILR